MLCLVSFVRPARPISFLLFAVLSCCHLAAIYATFNEENRTTFRVPSFV